MITREYIGIGALLLIVLVAIILIILKLVEKKLVVDVVGARTKRDEMYLAQITNINPTTKDAIQKIDSVAKNFFFEAYNLKKLDYSKIREKFEKMKYKEGIKFSELMAKKDYSQEELSQKEVGELLRLLQKIVSKKHIIQEEEKEEIVKKQEEMQKQSFFKKLLGSKKQEEVEKKPQKFKK